MLSPAKRESFFMVRSAQRLAAPKTGTASRERILDGAEAVFAAKGFDASTIREIAAAASVPLGLVSYHFATKSDLFEAIGRASCRKECVSTWRARWSPYH